MRQNSKWKTKEIPTGAPEVPTAVVTMKPLKESKPRTEEAPVSSKESAPIGTERPRKKKAADAAQRRLRPATKKSQLIALLSTRTGTDVASISSALGWLPHTTRAALTMLRKAGYGVEAAKPKGGGAGRYRIVAMPATTGSAA